MALRFPRSILLFFFVSTATRLAWADPETDNFREDVFACEDAVGHLAGCCPDFHPANVRCVYDHHDSSGCDSYTKYREDPAVSIAEADCVLALDCGAIRERGICERAQRMKPERSATDHSEGRDWDTRSEGNPEALCP